MTLEKFQYKHGKSTIVLPKFSDIFASFGEARKFRKLEQGEQLFALIEKAADEKNLALIDELPMADMEKLFKAWQEHAQVTAGESSASATS